MRSSIAAVVLAVSLAGCSMIPSAWDANEAAVITDIRQSVRAINCDTPITMLDSTSTVMKQREWLQLYAESRESQDVLDLIVPFNDTLVGLHERAKTGKVSKAYCNAKVTILEKQSADMASALQARFNR